MRAQELYAVADTMQQAAGACGRAAAAAALTVTAAVAAHAAIAVAIALLIVGVFMIRRITWARLAHTVRRQALGAELFESFRDSNWRERTGWARVA